MKANEFVKKFGWGAAKHKAVELKIIESMGVKLSIEDEKLKRLVESHELIERVGGLSLAKDFYEKFECVHIGLNLIECRKLGRVIKDVESCL